jgi:hypothetical protein
VINHAVYLKNYTVTKALYGKTPYEFFHGTGLLEFGSQVWFHDTSRSKLDGRAVVGQWVDFDEDSSGHWIYFSDKRNVSVE